jgi:hypothetical protein
MKLQFLAGLAFALLFTTTPMLAADATLTGYIADSKCNTQAAHEGARECTIKCVKEGAKYVFVSDGDKKVYSLDDQSKVAEHAGHHVTVTGSVDGDSLKLSSIAMAAPRAN